jgi:CheY-like chemotaxis protein
MVLASFHFSNSFMGGRVCPSGKGNYHAWHCRFPAITTPEVESRKFDRSARKDYTLPIPFFIGATNAAIARIEDYFMASRDDAMRILVADDSDKLRGGLCSLLESRPGWIVCGEARNGREAIEKALELKPDVILMDISMPDLNGLDAARRIHEQVPDSQILIVTEHDSRTLAYLPRQPGVRGYVRKSHLDLDLISAVEAASDHRSVSDSASPQVVLPRAGHAK